MKALKETILEALYPAMDSELETGSHVKNSFGKRFSFIYNSSTSKGEVISNKTMKNVPIKPVQAELPALFDGKYSYDTSKIEYFAKWLDNLPFDKFDNLIATKFAGINRYGKEVAEIEKYIMDCAKKDNIFASPDKVVIGFHIPDKFDPNKITVTAGLNNGRPHRIMLDYNIR